MSGLLECHLALERMTNHEMIVIIKRNNQWKIPAPGRYPSAAARSHWLAAACRMSWEHGGSRPVPMDGNHQNGSS